METILARKLSKTLIIGLGGTGQNVIMNVKKNLLLKYGEIPQSVGFFCIDTDKSDSSQIMFEYEYNGKKNKENVNLIPDQFIRLAPEDLKKFIDVNEEYLKPFFDLDRVRSESANLVMGDGANGVRWVSRMRLYHDKYRANVLEKFRVKLDFLLNNVKSDNDTKYLYPDESVVTCHIVGSIAGGTGSGLCIDIPFMIKSTGLCKRIYGYFADYSFFEGLPSTYNIKVNTFAALSEIDLLQSHDFNNANTFDQIKYNYIGEFAPQSKPYESVFYFSKLNKAGVTIDKNHLTNSLASILSNACGEFGLKMESTFNNDKQCVPGFAYKQKRRNFGSIGYSELVFNRIEFKDYILQCKALDILKNINVASSDAIEISVSEFISKNQLDEGRTNISASSVNQLTDSIINLGTILTEDYNFPNIKSDKDSHIGLENAKSTFLNGLSEWFQTNTQRISLSDNSTKKLTGHLNQILFASGGIEKSKSFINELRACFTDMKFRLTEEVEYHKNQIETLGLELKNHLDKVKALANPGVMTRWFGSDADLKKEIKNYSFKVSEIGDDSSPTLRRLNLEILRKLDAIKVYNSLLAVLDTFYKRKDVDDPINPFEGLVCKYFNIFEVLKQELSDKISYYASSLTKNTIGVSRFEYSLNKYFTEYRGTLLPGMATNFDPIKIISDSFLSSGQKDVIIYELMKAVYDNRSGFLLAVTEDKGNSKINSIEEIIAELFLKEKDPIKFKQATEMLGNIFTINSAPLFSHDFTSMTDSNVSKIVQDSYLIGSLYDQTKSSIFDKLHPSQVNQYIMDQAMSEIVPVPDPNRITVLRVQQSGQGFNLSNMDALRREFELTIENSYWSYTDKRWADRKANLFPEIISQDAMFVWAFAWLLGLVVRDASRYKLYVTSAFTDSHPDAIIEKETGMFDYFNNKIKNPADLEKCFIEFAKNNLLVQNLKGQILEAITQGKEDFKIKIRDYINGDLLRSEEKRGKKSFTDGEEGIMNREQKEILKYLPELNVKGGKRIESIDEKGKARISILGL